MKDESSTTAAGAEPRWLEAADGAGAQALRRALDDAAALPEVGEPFDGSRFNKQRVWARVQVPWRPSAGQRAMVIVVVGAAIAGVVTLLAAGHRRQGDGIAARGPLPAAPSTFTAEEAPAGTVLTGPDEEAHRRLAGGVDVVLEPLGALIVGEGGAAPEIKSGRAHFSVPHQAPGQRYVVRAAGYRVVVLGTVFDVAVDARGVSVSLVSGVVEIESAATGQRVAHLDPGQRWSNGEAAAPLALPARAATSGSTAEAGILAAARRARRQGDAREALALYGRLARSNGRLAESAQYEMASIEDQDLHDSARALRSWERYRDQHPRGVLRAEADLSIIEMLTRLGQEGRALDEARAFLRRNPGSERRSEVARVAADLARTRGDCAAAAAFYDQALAGRLSAADTDDAAFHRAACLVALDDGRGADAVRAYLGRFPRGRHAGEAQRLVAVAAPAPAASHP